MKCPECGGSLVYPEDGSACCRAMGTVLPLITAVRELLPRLGDKCSCSVDYRDQRDCFYCTSSDEIDALRKAYEAVG